METQIVYERQVGGSLEHGPCEFVRVGVRFDDRVVWLENAYFPGSNDAAFKRGEALAQEIVRRCNLGVAQT
jgi:hypothetical protein